MNRPNANPPVSPPKVETGRIAAASHEVVLKKWALIIVGLYVLLLTAGGVWWSVSQPDRIEKYWLVATPLISSAISAMAIYLTPVKLVPRPLSDD